MDTSPEKKFVPHSGGKRRKKKKKKKRRHKSREEPQHDPHFTPAHEQQIETKEKRKHKRKTHFQVDDAAPIIKISGGYNRKQNAITNVTSGLKRDRQPKGTRKVVRSGDNRNIDMQTLQSLEARRRKAPKVLEDESGDEEEEKQSNMNIDDNETNALWNKDEYTPISLKTKPSYGSKIKQDVMFDVFKEDLDYGNNFVFIQMPPILPLVSHLNQDEKRDIANFKRVEQSLLRQMGEGEVGKIRIRKSGKTELVIGDYVLNVDFASPMDCYQQVMHIHCENSNDGDIKGTSQFLGNVPPQNNLVCSYEAEDLLL